MVGVSTGDEAAFGAFLAEHGDRLFTYARRLVGDRGDAEDLLQVACERLAKRWRRVDEPAAWVRTCLVNLARDRARRRHLVAEPVDREPVPVPVPDVADAIASAAALSALLDLLPPRQRITVVLRVLDDRSEAETARLLRCSVGTVKSNLARGLDRLRVHLEQRSTA
jgi:RNA polymerase sigma-70 factor (sigma-E family)